MAKRPKIIDELRRWSHEPLLPIEKKLIVGSIVLGVVLLGLLNVGKPGVFPGRLRAHSCPK